MLSLLRCRPQPTQRKEARAASGLVQRGAVRFFQVSRLQVSGFSGLGLLPCRALDAADLVLAVKHQPIIGAGQFLSRHETEQPTLATSGPRVWEWRVCMASPLPLFLGVSGIDGARPDIPVRFEALRLGRLEP